MLGLGRFFYILVDCSLPLANNISISFIGMNNDACKGHLATRQIAAFTALYIVYVHV